jgi:hypothetical protein
LKACGAPWKAGVRDTRAVGQRPQQATAGGEDDRAKSDPGDILTVTRAMLSDVGNLESEV